VSRDTQDDQSIRFPQRNVEQCCAKIELLAERLDCDGAFDMDQLLIVVKIMEGAADECFRAWATTQFHRFNDTSSVTCVDALNSIATLGDIPQRAPHRIPRNDWPKTLGATS
jgi:hypothetical protein